jgi:hypothetical protein
MNHSNLISFLKPDGVAERGKYEDTKPSHSDSVIHYVNGIHDCSPKELKTWRKI